MIHFKTLSLIVLSAFLSFYGCKNKSDENQQSTDEASEVSNTVTPADGTITEPPQNADGVWHFTCPKGCAGGAGAATPCALCGATLVHNAAYHGNTNTQPGANQIPPATNAMPSGTPTVTPSATPPAEPAQNAAGVWHFTCAKGCKGGAGVAGICSGCGGPLAHNQAYHN